MSPAEAQPLLALIDALGTQVVALRTMVLATVQQPAPPKPEGAPCGHADAVPTDTRDGVVWVCPEGCHA